MVNQIKNVSLQWESVTSVGVEFQRMANMHHKEIFGEEVEVDMGSLSRLEKQGSLIALTARCDGKPVGYYCCIVLPDIFARGKFEARDIGIFVLPEFRGKGITTEMQKYMDERLKSVVKKVIVSYPYESTIPERAGYTKKEILYERVL